MLHHQQPASWLENATDFLQAAQGVVHRAEDQRTNDAVKVGGEEATESSRRWHVLLAHGDMTRFRLLSLCYASMSAGVVNRPAEKHLTFLSLFPREVDGVLHCYYVTLIFRLHSLWFSSALI